MNAERTPKKRTLILATAGIVCLLLGMFAFVGWHAPQLEAVRLSYGWVPAHCAVAFIFSGIALLSTAVGWLRLTQVSGLLVLILGLLLVAEPLFGADLGIARNLIAYSSLSPYAVEVAGHAAFCYSLIGMAFLLMGSRRRYRYRALVLALLGAVIVAMPIGEIVGFALGVNAPGEEGFLAFFAFTAPAHFLAGTAVIAYAWYDAPPDAPENRHWPPLLLIVGVVAATLLLWETLRVAEIEHVRQVTATQAEAVEHQIEARLQSDVRGLLRLAWRWEQQGGPDPGLREGQASMLFQHMTGLAAIEWVDQESQVRWRESRGGHGLSPERLDEYRTMRSQALARATEEGVTLSAPFLDAEGHPGFLTVAPITLGPAAGTFLIGRFHAPDLLSEVVPEEIAAGYAVAVFEDGARLFERNMVEATPEWMQATLVDVYGSAWEVMVAPTPNVLAELQSPIPGVVLGSGFLIVLLLVWVDFLAQRATLRASDLERTNRTLSGEIGRREQAEHVLEESRSFLGASLDSLNEGIIACDRDGVLTLFNPAAAALHGRSLARIGADQWAEHYHLRTAEGDRALPKEDNPLYRALQGEVVRDMEILTAAPGTPPRTLLVNAQPMNDARGAKLGAVAVLHDITERKRAQRELDRKTAYVELLRSVAVAANEARVFDDAARAAVDEICAAFAWPVGHVLLHTGTGRLVSTDIWHLGDPTLFDPVVQATAQIDFDVCSCFQREVLTSGEPRWTRDLGNGLCEARAMVLRGAGARSAYAFPVRIRAEIVAVLEFFSPRSEEPDPSLLAVMGQIGTQLGLVAERQRAEEGIRESELRFRSVTESAQDAVITHDREGIVRSWNRGASKLFGYEPQEIVGRSLKQLIPARLHGMFEQWTRRIAEGKGTQLLDRPLEQTGRRKDGSEFPFEMTLSTWTLRGQRFYTGILRDITERREHEQAMQRLNEDLERRVHERTAALRRANLDLAHEVAERTRAEAETRRYAERITSILESITDAFFAVDYEWRITYVNGRAEQLLRKGRSELLGENLWQALPSATPARFHRELHRVQKEQRPVEFEEHFAPFDRWYEVHAYPGREGISVYFEDVTQRKRAEESLAKKTEQLAVTLQSIADAVVTSDTSGKVMMLNKVAEELTGWRQEQAAGRPFREIFRIVKEGDREPMVDPVTQVLEKKRVIAPSERAVLVARDGRERLVAESGAPILGPNGEVTGVVVVLRDETEKRRMEQDLIRAENLESIGLLAGGIAHDFNNILTAILGNISLAKLYATPGDPIHETLTEAEKAFARARDLTQQLLTFSRGGAPIKKTASIAELLRDTTTFVLRGSNVGHDLLIDKDLWPARFDPGQVSQVINNLLINAKQAMPNGGMVRIAAENAQIAEERGGVRPGKYIKITIEDQGVGIPRAHLPRIFDPYFTTKQKGSGLGLATVYSIIKRHEGLIEVESTPGVGTRFTIFLPAAERKEGERPEEGGKVLSGEGRILLMDDEETILQVGRALLNRLGYAVEVAHDGTEMLNRYERALQAGERFDAVIMDLTVPGGMGGKDCIGRLRQVDPEVRAIVSSGYSNDPVMAEFRKYGFQGMIVKPYQLRELSEAVHDVIAAH